MDCSKGIDIVGMMWCGISLEEPLLIAGPCAVESEEQICTIAKAVKKQGAKMLRGGAFKPRTSPLSFRGLGVKAFYHLADARKQTGLPFVTEVLDEQQLMDAINFVDAVQIGARSMQNFSLLEAVGVLHIPVILKRGFGNTVKEWLSAAEYITNKGNHQVLLCERGIRTFSDAGRFTLDLNAVAMIRAMNKLPIIVDPSHAAGNAEYVIPLAKAGLAAGAQGLLIEVHHQPKHSMVDAEQAIRPEQLAQLRDCHVSQKTATK